MYVQEEGKIRQFSVGVYVMKAGKANWEKATCASSVLVPGTKLGIHAAVGTGMKAKYSEMQIQI